MKQIDLMSGNDVLYGTTFSDDNGRYILCNNVIYKVNYMSNWQDNALVVFRLDEIDPNYAVDVTIIV